MVVKEEVFQERLAKYMVSKGLLEHCKIMQCGIAEDGYYVLLGSSILNCNPVLTARGQIKRYKDIERIFQFVKGVSNIIVVLNEEG